MAETQVKKEIFIIALRDDAIALLPFKVRGILGALAGERGMLVKGGIARLCLMTLIAKKGKLEGRDRLETEKRIGDIDLVIWDDGRQPNFRQAAAEKFESLRQRLATAGVIFEPKNIDIIDLNGAAAPVEKIFDTTDLTINELALGYENGWRVYYTANAIKHVAKGWGVFVRPKPTNIRYDAGRVFPSPLGMVRLLKFLVTGKVKKIYLPKHWRTLYFQDYTRKVKEGLRQEGAPLGLHSLVLMENYFGGDDRLQKKAMVALYDLGFTDLLDPDLYIRRQKDIFSRAKLRFELKDLSFDDVFDRYLEEKNHKYQQRAGEQCAHEYEPAACDLCGKRNCPIEVCAKCGRGKSGPIMPCTVWMREGKLEPEGFYEIK